MTPRPSTFLPETIDAVLDRACRAVGLDPAGASLLRLGENMLYQLTEVPVVVRIGRGRGHWDDAVKEVAVSEWLAGQGFPAAQVYSVGQQQPVAVDEYPVTFWRFIDGRPADISEAGVLGDLLRRLHRLERPAGVDLPPVDGFGRVAARLDAVRIPVADADFLRQRARELEQDLAGLRFALPTAALHGDAHVKNVMVTEDGPVLIDLETFAVGPAEWDLTKTATEASMGMLAERDYAAFVDGYGYDVMSWSGWPVLQGIQQLRMVSWLAQNVDHSPKIGEEVAKRIQTMRSGRLVAPWTGF